MRCYMVRADGGQSTDIFKNQQFVSIGWGISAKISNFSSETIADVYKETHPDSSKMNIGQNVGQIKRFLSDINIGDIVITPYRDGTLLISEVISEPYYETDEEKIAVCSHLWRRKIKVIRDKVLRSSFEQKLQNSIKGNLTCFEIKYPEQISDFLENKETKKIAKNIESIEVACKEKLKDRLLDLHHSDFETFIAILLQTYGFLGSKTSDTKDGGVDYVGQIIINNIAEINLKVQVKRYKASNTIHKKAINDFRGSLDKNDQACFITTCKFSKDAQENASNLEKVKINLINGDQLVDMIIDKYDDILEIISATPDYAEIGKILTFKKMLIIS